MDDGTKREIKGQYTWFVRFEPCVHSLIKKNGKYKVFSHIGCRKDDYDDRVIYILNIQEMIPLHLEIAVKKRRNQLRELELNGWLRSLDTGEKKGTGVFQTRLM